MWTGGGQNLSFFVAVTKDQKPAQQLNAQVEDGSCWREASRKNLQVTGYAWAADMGKNQITVLRMLQIQSQQRDGVGKLLV